jgi:hypothetical protein
MANGTLFTRLKKIGQLIQSYLCLRLKSGDSILSEPKMTFVCVFCVQWHGAF